MSSATANGTGAAAPAKGAPSSTVITGATPPARPTPAAPRYIPTEEERDFARRVAELPQHLFKKGEPRATAV